MKYGIITIGSRGDVQPFLALGKRLIERGHSVRIATFSIFRNVVEREGIEFQSLTGDAAEVIRMLIGEQVPFNEYFKNLDRILNPIKENFLSDVVRACEGVDAILYTVLGSVAYHVAEKKQLPAFRVFFNPLDPTNEFPAITAPNLHLGRLYNRFTFFCGDILWSNATRRNLNDWRTSMGLTPIKKCEFPYRTLRDKPIPTLYPYSEMIGPKPHDWDDYRYLTGYWIKDIDSDWKAPNELLNFLSSGPKPIYIGFGSMVGGDFKKLMQIVMQSIVNTGQRAILSSGWGKLNHSDLPDNIYQVDNVPHEWLFPRMSAVCHHGGSGTTAAGIRAGVPSILIPFGGDQPYWGDCVYRLGIGTKPIIRKKLTEKALTHAIEQAISDQQMIEKAKKIGTKLRSEDGIGNAVQVIERLT